MEYVPSCNKQLIQTSLKMVFKNIFRAKKFYSFDDKIHENDNKIDKIPQLSSSRQEGEKFQQYLCTVLVCLGAVLVGSTIGWSSPAFKFLTDDDSTNGAFKISEIQASWVAALAPLGAIFGAIFSGIVVNYCGSRGALLVFCVPGIIGWLLNAFSTHVIPLYVGRFTVGSVMGIFASIVPTYITDIAEVSVRGALGLLFDTFLNCGVMLMFLLGYFNSYNVLSSANAALCAAYFACLLYLPESPNYLVKKNRPEKAEKSLRKLRGATYDVQRELAELRSYLAGEMSQKFSISVLRKRKNVKSLILGLSFMAVQQMCAIDAIIAYCETIFIKANVSSASFWVLILGIVELGFTILSTLVVDRIGRKVLLFASGIGTTLALASLGWYFWLLKDTNSKSESWLPVVILLFYIATFALGLGPVTWLILGELLGPEIKKFAFGVSIAFNLSLMTTVVYTFWPLINFISAAWTFWMYALLSTITCTCTLIFVPETKNKTLEQIQNELAGMVTHKTVLAV